MSNPCILLDSNNINSSQELIISESFSQPIILPEGPELTVYIKKNLDVHLVAPNSPVKLVLESDAQAYWYGVSNTNMNLCARLESQTMLNIININLGAQDTNNLINIDLLAPKAQTNFLGLDQLSKTQRSSLRLVINHRTEQTKSSQAFRGIYAHESLGFFEGKVIVHPHAQQSSAQQLYKALLLSERARAHVRPELEINNFDITASHGASIGQLDEEALFYLCSRGLSLKSAQKILVESLAQDILQEIHPVMREYLSLQVAHALEKIYE